MDLIGITSGFLAAVLMAAAFLASGWAIRRTKGLDGIGLIANASVIMGLLSIVGLYFVWTPELGASLPRHIPVVICILAFYFTGQSMMFGAQRSIDPSIIVPLLGLKLPMLALLTLIINQATFNALQVIAIILTVAAAFVLNHSGQKVPLRSFVLVVGACLFYSLSDMNITRDMKLLIADGTGSQVAASAQCTFMTYIGCGIIGLIVIAFHKAARVRGAIRNSIPYAFIWIGSIVALSMCFVRLGTVHGNIIQSTRGIFTIVFSPLLVWCGMTYLEQKVSKLMLLRRLIAAVMMLAAVILYNYCPNA